MTARVAMNEPWYRTAPVPDAVDAALLCTWSATPTGRHRLIPDGCLDALWLSTGEVWLCGPETRAWSFRLPQGVHAAGVRFRPGVIPTLCSLRADSLLDRRVRWATVVGEAAEASLATAMAAATAPDQRAGVWIAAVQQIIDERDPVDPQAAAVIAHLVCAPRARVTDVAAAVGFTSRQMQRRCGAWFGYPLGTLARIMRFQRFRALHASGHQGSLAVLAARAGYADHPHLARECRAITGSTVTEFLAEDFATFPDMSDPYKTHAATGRTLVG